MALFRSRHKGFVQNVRKSLLERDAWGQPIGVKLTALRAEFGLFGPERTIVNPETGHTETVAEISGGFYDSVAAQEREGWSDEERESVEAKLRDVARTRPDYVTEVVPVHVPAAAPWPTYDATPIEATLASAVTLGLVPEALRYERENLRRLAVTEPLEEELRKLPEVDRERAESVSEIPASMLEMPSPTGVRVGRAPETTASGIVKGTPGFVEKENPQKIVL